jgi:hypothetical protein
MKHLIATESFDRHPIYVGAGSELTVRCYDPFEGRDRDVLSTGPVLAPMLIDKIDVYAVAGSVAEEFGVEDGALVVVMGQKR